jgi:hypothetical protein
LWKHNPAYILWGGFPLFTLFTPFFDSSGWLFECKNFFC